MKTLIAIPCLDMTPSLFTESMLNLYKPEGTKVCMNPGSLVSDSRNLLSLTAIENDFDNVMWIDSDMILPQDAIQKLMDDMQKTGSEMVSGVYIKRKSPFTPVIFDELAPPSIDSDGKPVKHVHEFDAYPVDELFRVKGCGFGCVMTSVKLLKQVWDKYGPAFNQYPWAGEDISFCHRVNMLGHDIWCDSSIVCGHVGTHMFIPSANGWR